MTIFSRFTVSQAARIIYQDASISGPTASWPIPLDLLVADVEDHFRSFCHIEKYLHAPLRLEDQFLVQINNGIPKAFYPFRIKDGLDSVSLCDI